MRTIGLLIIPQILVASFPWWYYGFRTGIGYDEGMPMRLIDVIAFGLLASCAWLSWWQSRRATRRIFRLGLLLLLASSAFLCAVVAWAFIFVPYLPAHFPPWTTGTTLATTLDIAAPLIGIIVALSFGATLIDVFCTRSHPAICLGFFLVAPTLTFATEQARDTITFAGQHDSILEHPLNEFLRRLPAIPRFDIPSTANYKGYTARWEVKDSRLYLATFHATTNRKAFSISSLFPGRKLPIQADWYSGAIQIISDSETLVQGRFNYERITVLQVTNGVVIATNWNGIYELKAAGRDRPDFR